MELKEFKKQAKELAVKCGLNKSDVSIVSDTWLRIRIACEDLDLYALLKKEFEKLAGFKNKSDVLTDYFDYDVAVKNSSGGSYGGLIITKA